MSDKRCEDINNFVNGNLVFCSKTINLTSLELATGTLCLFKNRRLIIIFMIAGRALSLSFVGSHIDSCWMSDELLAQ